MDSVAFLEKYGVRPPNEVDHFLSHYGVKGMKWGVVNEDDPVGRKPGAGPDGSTSKPGANEPRLSPRQKKMLIGGAAIAGTMLVAYGGYRFSQSGQMNAAILRGRQALGVQKGPFNVNKELARTDLSVEQLATMVNAQANPGYGQLGTKLNCRRATFAYEMRRRGFDVSATRTINGSGQDFVGAYNALNDTGDIRSGSKIARRVAMVREARTARRTGVEGDLTNAFRMLEGDRRNLIQPTNDSVISGIFTQLSKEPNGSRGEISMNWKPGGRHSMAYEIVNNRLVVFDAQTGEHFTYAKELRRALGGDMISEATHMRLDNLDLNTDFLQRWLRNAG